MNKFVKLHRCLTVQDNKLQLSDAHSLLYQNKTTIYLIRN